MAAKFVTLDEAAQLLGTSKDRLNELREAGKVHAYRDGSSWKFRGEEIEKLAASGDLLGSSAETDDEAEQLPLDVDWGLGDEADEVLLSEVELGDSTDASSSKIIGKPDSQDVDDDSDLKLADEEASDLKIAPETTEGGGSDLKLADEPDLTLAGSDIQLAGGGDSGVLDAVEPSESGSSFADLEELDVDLDGGSSKTDMAAATSASEEATVTSEDQIDSLSLEGGETLVGDPSDSGIQMDDPSAPGTSESSIQLAADEDDELVLGEGSGSDITFSGEDSGISLVDASDSGLPLDEVSLDLGGSSVESLELGEEDEVAGGSGAFQTQAAELKADDDFLLTPLEEAGDEGEDSGSQVIALDDDADFDEGVTVLGTEGAPALEEDLGGGGIGVDTMAAPATAGAAALATTPVGQAEATFSGANVVFLSICTLLLGIGGMMMYDLVRNIWSWEEAYSLNSTIMDGLLKAIPIGS